MVFWQTSSDRATNKELHYNNFIVLESKEERMATYMLMSGYLTNSGLSTPDYYNLSNFKYSKLDQLLSTLCSLEKLDLDYADFYLDYDADNAKHREVVEDFILRKFSRTRICIYSHRLEYFSQWHEAGKNIPHDVDFILLMNNLDHTFVPEAKDYFMQFLRFLETREDNAIGCILHWPEFISCIGAKKFIQPTGGENIFVNKMVTTFGTTLVKPSFFRSWWEKDFTNGNRIVRPDNPFGNSVRFNWAPHYIPSREFFRHLDGYGHVGISAPQAGPLKPCCLYSNGEIVHTDWVRGFDKGLIADLPYEKPMSIDLREKSSISYFQIVDYLINSNSYYFSFFRTIQLIQPKKLKDYYNIICILISLLKYKHMREAFKRNFFSYKHYKLRFQYQVVTRYNKFQISNPRYPKKISEFKLLKFFKKIMYFNE